MLHNKRKIILIIVIICLIGLVGLGISYAYWKFTYIQTDNNIAVSKCLKLDMTNESNEINLNNMYPISDEEGRKLIPYSFKITNTCSMSAEYKVNLEMLEGTTLNSKYLASLVNNGNVKLLSNYDTTKTTISGSVESRTLDTNILTPEASKEYSISLWMDKSVTLADDAQNKSFSAKVVIDASMYTGVVDKIVAQLDTTGKCPTLNTDGTIKVTNVEKSNGYLCKTLDNYGTSYYYRGNVQNNYVKFANFYWRIVRINGDGSIRMIYDGTVAHENGDVSEDRSTGKSAFNTNWRTDGVIDNDAYVYYDNASLGYMYGNRDGVAIPEEYYTTDEYSNTLKVYVGNSYNFDEVTKKFKINNPELVSVSNLNNYIGYYTWISDTLNKEDKNLNKVFEVASGDDTTRISYGFLRYGTTSSKQAQTNTNDSDVKKYLDDWYRQNLSSYSKYLDDSLFCNDRRFAVNNAGTGAGMSTSLYFNNSWHPNNTTLKCNKNDSFSVSYFNGNGDLIYPIGLLTSEEGVLAGGFSSNSNYYLYDGNKSLLMSPDSFDGNYHGGMRAIDETGDAVGWIDVDEIASVKPVINLKPNSLTSGNGTINNPYVVE